MNSALKQRSNKPPHVLTLARHYFPRSRRHDRLPAVSRDQSRNLVRTPALERQHPAPAKISPHFSRRCNIAIHQNNVALQRSDGPPPNPSHTELQALLTGEISRSANTDS